ncbi:uncharacterized protein C8Q71DRAFT_273630 [Rhodofomes roseus]|uniref:Uncharacterized protein n=1 Tax=Rhodofomes roseus TaxID=34475 RepID=A0ABQ8K4G3_9APHY|nr:uncharacterized protein C8Q71DRAFT_288677 [Rhodofomes roseus]XP_047774984.1 uncharacterized protein C8Q71DRAFT_273630 [Rhodofomes roseus]KAH9831506.1 hypothetical protein C8Q71DRAFT_288677 [Rhodofomes roseus]KAH9831938.1 hypothetical protein C8Q71DRAFT_273630 [Rhodofomes roseus]
MPPPPRAHVSRPPYSPRRVRRVPHPLAHSQTREPASTRVLSETHTGRTRSPDFFIWGARSRIRSEGRSRIGVCARGCGRASEYSIISPFAAPLSSHSSSCLRYLRAPSRTTRACPPNAPAPLPNSPSLACTSRAPPSGQRATSPPSRLHLATWRGLLARPSFTPRPTRSRPRSAGLLPGPNAGANPHLPRARARRRSCASPFRPPRSSLHLQHLYSSVLQRALSRLPSRMRCVALRSRQHLAGSTACAHPLPPAARMHDLAVLLPAARLMRRGETTPAPAPMFNTKELPATSRTRTQSRLVLHAKVRSFAPMDHTKASETSRIRIQ